jgi:hypothetical protein
MAPVKLCIANLTTETTAADLADLFAPFGPVASADVWLTEGSATATRIGYVVMSAGGAAAVTALDRVSYRGRNLVVGEIGPWDARGPGRG